MIKNRFHAALLSAVILTFTTAVSEAAPSGAKQWSVDKTDQIGYETDYVLYNLGSKIGYDNRTFGVDLARGHNGGFFAFRRKASPGTRDRRLGPIASDDNVAIFNTKTLRYLRFFPRGDAKAELEWSNTPVYEWQIQDQSASGGRVHFALFNSRVKKYLVYKIQNYGINLGWLNLTPERKTSVAMKRQQITDGWVPFLAVFGENTKGNLLSVQNADQKGSLWFVKPGKRTNNCSDPNATVRVPPRQMMTHDQMKILYGSVTPRLPIYFLACLSSTTPPLSILNTYVNITFRLDP